MTQDAQPQSVCLRAEAIGVGYGRQPVLKDVSLTVRRGEVRAILGTSGAGKSTLLRHLVGLAVPTAGRIELMGCDFVRATPQERARVLAQVGVLFQSGALLGGMTILDNVALPLRQLTELPADLIFDIARMKLALVGLEDAADQVPQALSGGMKKRAALARAMALDPAILFCDEPSAGLDPVTAAALDALLLSLRDQYGMAVVVVTHELASIHAIADTVLMLDGGAVVADGPLREVEALTLPAVQSFFGRRAWHAVKKRPSMWDVLQPMGATPVSAPAVAADSDAGAGTGTERASATEAGSTLLANAAPSDTGHGRSGTWT